MREAIGIKTAQLIATKAATNVDASFSVIHVKNGAKIYPLIEASENFWEVDVTYNSDNTFRITVVNDGNLETQTNLSIEESNVVLTVETILFSLSLLKI